MYRLLRVRVGLLALAVAIVLPACGDGGQVIETTSTRLSGYSGQCKLWAGRQDKAVKDEAYEPVTLVVDHWPGRSEPTVPEADFAKALLQVGPDGLPAVRRSAMLARSGLGKSRFAESLRAQLCGKLPMYLVDAKLAAAYTGPDNPVLVQMARQQGGMDASLNKPTARVLIALDGLDEVDLRARPSLLAALQETLVKWPKGQMLLLARPPVAEKDYGVEDLQVKVSLRPLTCERAQAFIGRKVGKADEVTAFLQFLRRHGLDAEVNLAGGCGYSYMNSYGDIEAQLAFYKKAMAPRSETLVSRSHAHEALLVARLGKELQELGWTTEQALQLLDKMTAGQLRRTASRQPRFAVTDCQLATDGLGATQQQRVCEKLFQSPLFAPTDGGYGFSGQGLADLFVARWLSDLAKSGKDCAAVLAQTAVLHEGEVFTYLVGQPGGLQCGGKLMDNRCNLNPKTDVLTVFDEGLPAGAARAQHYAFLKSQYESIHWKMCAKKTLEGLQGTF
jgi:hypothetical protein